MALEFPQDKTSYLGAVNFTVVGSVGNQLGQTCTLYLPQGVQVADKVEYENTSLGMTGGALENAMGGGGAQTETASVVDEVDGGGAGFMGFIKGMVANVTTKTGVSQTGLGGAVASSNRVAPNPNTRALFKQVSLRAFMFTFKLIPVNESEANSIPEIIKFFRSELYPEEIDAGGGVSLGYNFPNQFQITMMYAGQEIGTKLLPTYLESFTTTYNPSTQAMHKEGKFSEVDITMNFIEGEALNRKRITEDGF